MAGGGADDGTEAADAEGAVEGAPLGGNGGFEAASDWRIDQPGCGAAAAVDAIGSVLGDPLGGFGAGPCATGVALGMETRQPALFIHSENRVPATACPAAVDVSTPAESEASASVRQRFCCT